MPTLPLSSLLKGQEGNFFYNPQHGYIQYRGISDNYMTFNKGVGVVCLPLDGFYDDGSLALFPDKTNKDWNKWIKEHYPELEYASVRFNKNYHYVEQCKECSHVESPKHKECYHEVDIYSLDRLPSVDEITYPSLHNKTDYTGFWSAIDIAAYQDF